MSSQGQITIPRDIRKKMGMGGGSEILLTSNSEQLKTLTIMSKPLSWVDRVAGTGKGIWGKDVDQYVDNIRNEW